MLVDDRCPTDRAEISSRGARLGESVTKPGERVQVSRGGPRDVTYLESTQSMPDVGGVADLAHLAVAHHIHAGIDLVAYPVPDRAENQAVVCGTVDGLAPVFGQHQIDDILGPRQLPTWVVRMRPSGMVGTFLMITGVCRVDGHGSPRWRSRSGAPDRLCWCRIMDRL